MSEPCSSSSEASVAQLIFYDPATRRFHVDPLALDSIRTLTRPVAVASICGRPRQGKSYILRHLQPNDAPVFAVGSTFQPCTLGLWASAPVLLRQHAQATGGVEAGREYHLLFLDTEGIDGASQTRQHSAQILCLAALLSSVLIYNQMGTVDESAVESLATVANTAAAMHASAGGASPGNASDADLSVGMDLMQLLTAPSDDASAGAVPPAARHAAYAGRSASWDAPHLVWLLRDSYLAAPPAPPPAGEDQGQGQVGASGARDSDDWEEQQARAAQHYMEQHLPGDSPDVRSRNNMRAAICALFGRGSGSSSSDHASVSAGGISCISLVRPVLEEGQLQRLPDLPPSQLRPQFMQGVERLRGIVMQHAVPRRLRHGAISATDGSAPGSSGSGGSGGGGVMTGPVLAGLIEAYVEAINAGAMPSITTMWQGMVERECQRAVGDAVQQYRQELHDAADMVYEQYRHNPAQSMVAMTALSVASEVCKDRAAQAYAHSAAAFAAEPSHATYRAALDTALTDTFEEMRALMRAQLNTLRQQQAQELQRQAARAAGAGGGGGAEGATGQQQRQATAERQGWLPAVALAVVAVACIALFRFRPF